MARRIGMCAGLLLAAEALLACGGGATKGAPAAAPAGAQATSEDASFGLLEYHRHHHHGGVTLFLAMSLDTLGVPAEKRAAVENIRVELHRQLEPARVAEQRLVSAVADGVAASVVDAPKVRAAFTEVVAAADGVHAATFEALNELHSILTPAERAALADKVDAHWAVWQTVNRGVPEPETSRDSHIASLAIDLGLTPAQEDAARLRFGEVMKGVAPFDAAETTSFLRAFGTAFRGERFEAQTVALASGSTGRLVGWGAIRMARVAEAVSPVLTPEQRTRFVAELREHAAHNPTAAGSR